MRPWPRFGYTGRPGTFSISVNGGPVVSVDFVIFAPVPEPGTLLLVASVLGAAGAYRSWGRRFSPMFMGLGEKPSGGRECRFGSSVQAEVVVRTCSEGSGVKLSVRIFGVVHVMPGMSIIHEDRQHERPPAAVAPSMGPIPVT
jgi:hypothetical protein